jgi:hypothetical protein
MNTIYEMLVNIQGRIESIPIPLLLIQMYVSIYKATWAVS